MDKKTIVFEGVSEYGNLFGNNVDYADLIKIRKLMTKYNLYFVKVSEAVGNSSNCETYDISHMEGKTIFICEEDLVTDVSYKIWTVYILTQDKTLLCLQNKKAIIGNNSYTTLNEIPITEVNIKFSENYIKDLLAQQLFVKNI
jgi:hypothetical protein